MPWFHVVRGFNDSKYNLASWKVFYDYFILFTSYHTGESSCNCSDTDGFKVENELFTSRCRQNLKFGYLVYFIWVFIRVRDRNVLKFVPHGQHDYFSPFKLSNIRIVLWRCCPFVAVAVVIPWVERFHMTSRRPCWCSKTKEWWPW